MTQRYCESCGNLFDAKATGGTTPDGTYLCPSCATKQTDSPVAAADAAGSMMEKGGGLKKSVSEAEPEKLTFRCPGCNALLSSRKIDKRSRLTCPKCSEKVIINPDGTAELLTKRAPHMKKMDIPQKQKVYSDEDLEKLLDFGETQPIRKDSHRPSPTPRPPSGRGEPVAEQQTPVPPASAPDAPAGPQYVSDEEEERLKFLDEVQGPGRRKPTSGLKTLDSEVPAPPKKVPAGRKKLTKFGTDRHKSESVEDRMEAAKLQRASTRNKVLAIAFLVLPLLIGVIAYYNASKTAEEGAEESGLAKLVKAVGSKAKAGALAVNERVLKQEVVEPPSEEGTEPEEGTGEPDTSSPEPPETPETPEAPLEPLTGEPEQPEQPPAEAGTPSEPEPEPETPKETPPEPEPPSEPEKPAEPEQPEEPEKPAEPEPEKTPEKPAEPETPRQPEAPKEPAEKPAVPEKPPVEKTTQPEPEKKQQDIKTIECPNCGKTILRDAQKCPWCGAQTPPTPPKEGQSTTH